MPKIAPCCGNHSSTRMNLFKSPTPRSGSVTIEQVKRRTERQACESSMDVFVENTTRFEGEGLARRKLGPLHVHNGDQMCIGLVDDSSINHDQKDRDVMEIVFR